MKYGVLFFLAACCLLLTGCSELPSQATGPQGGGEPLPLNGEEQPRNAVFERRPMARRRRNAAMGRLRAPADSAACGCGGCAYPLWLYTAQSKEGLYMGADRAVLRSCQNGGQAMGEGFTAAVKFSRYAAEAAGADNIFPPEARSALFIDYCFAQTTNPQTGAAYPHLSAGAARAENWLSYGAAAKPCFGALMVAEEGGRYALAFCVGALTLPCAAGGSGKNAVREEIVYLGLSVKNAAAAADGDRQAGQIGLTAFAASAVRGFRLPHNYRPCKEHYRLDSTFWAEQFRAQIAAKQSLKQIKRTGGKPVAAAIGGKQQPDGAFALPLQADKASAYAPRADGAKGGFYLPREEAFDSAAALNPDWAAQNFRAPPEPPRRRYS